jgi:hypothetical protein
LVETKSQDKTKEQHKVEEEVRSGQATDQYIWPLQNECWIFKAKTKQPKYVTIIYFTTPMAVGTRYSIML